MQIVQQGSVNTSGLIVPQAIIQIVPPGVRPIAGVPTNILGIVGTAQWGPVNVPTTVGNTDQSTARFGALQNRPSDLGTAVAVSAQNGASIMYAVRVTDGTDVAASGILQDNATATAVTLTAKYTGTLGNALSVTLATGSAPSTTRATVSIPYNTPETFDNISGGILSNTVTPGTGYTSVPILTYSAPQLAGGVQAVGSASLAVVGTPTIGAGGTGYVNGDTLTLANGVVVKVATSSAGAILTFTLMGTAGTNAGSITSGNAPTNPVPQLSTSGVGINATVNLAWGLGPVTMTQTGTGYTSATCTVTGAGSIIVATGIWLNLVNAINLGINGVRAASSFLVASRGAGVGTPVLITTTLTGGQDGVANVTSSVLIGTDTAPRKGMYALRGTGCAVVNLADLADNTKWTAMTAFALSEGAFLAAATAAGDTISNAATELATAGVNSYGFKALFGDWIYWQDEVNGVTRLLSPATFWAGARANTAPQNSSLNVEILGIVATQKTMSGGVYSDADLLALATARMDVICNPAPGGSYFAPRFGNSSSSDPTINGENYTMMTNFLAKSVGAWAGSNIGQLQTPTQRRQAKSTLDNFFVSLWTASPQQIGNAQGTIPWQVILDDTVNPAAQVTLGYEVAVVKVQYLSVIKFFIVNLQGGQTVTIAIQNQAPSQFTP